MEELLSSYISLWSKPFSEMTPGDLVFLVGAPVGAGLLLVALLTAVGRVFEIVSDPKEWASEQARRWRERDAFTKWVLRGCGVLLVVWVILIAWIA